ncbi:hypothetical protein ACJX0J_035699, partial [Zea mays]
MVDGVLGWNRAYNNTAEVHNAPMDPKKTEHTTEIKALNEPLGVMLQVSLAITILIHLQKLGAIYSSVPILFLIVFWEDVTSGFHKFFTESTNTDNNFYTPRNIDYGFLTRELEKMSAKFG